MITLHLIIVMLLVGGIISAIFFSLKMPQQWLSLRSLLLRALLWLLVFAGLTGTLLVHPRHFTFHTHWIIAAYVLLLFCGGLLHYPRFMPDSTATLSRGWIKLERIALIISMLGFLMIIHDAVTKQTVF